MSALEITPAVGRSMSADAGAAAATTGALDEGAFTAFYGRTAAGLWRYLRRLAGDGATADDLLQESYVKLLGAGAAVPVDERHRRAYLYRIATNLLRDRWRRSRRREGWLERLFSGSPAASEPRRSDRRLDLDAVLATLRRRERTLLWLAYVEGYDHHEIAEIVGVAAASVRVMLFRARKKLAAVLTALGLEDDTP